MGRYKNKIKWQELCFIPALAEFILVNNYIEFDGKVYLQLKGLAMGTPAAPTLACIFMSHLELSMRDISPTIWAPILLYRRLIDDIFIITLTEEQADSFWQHFNSFNPAIKVVPHVSFDSVSFLDFVVYKPEMICNDLNRIILNVKLYEKPLNKHLYLPFHSSHPNHCFKAFIKAEIVRFRRNCSCDVDYLYEKMEFKTRLLARGYPQSLLDEWFEYYPNRNILLYGINGCNFRMCNIPDHMPVQHDLSVPISSRDAFVIPVRFSTLSASLNLPALVQPTHDMFITNDINSFNIFNTQRHVSYSVDSNQSSILRPRFSSSRFTNRLSSTLHC